MGGRHRGEEDRFGVMQGETVEGASGRGEPRLEIAIASALFVVGAVAFGVFAHVVGARDGRWVSAWLAFALLFAPYPALSVGAWGPRLSAWLGAAPFSRLALLLAIPIPLYAAYAIPTGIFELAFLWKYALYAGVPGALIASIRAAGADPLEAPLRLTAAILVLWLPVDFGVLPRFAVPAGAARSLDLMRLIALDVGLVLFVAAAPVRDLGFRFRLDRTDARAALEGLAAFGVVGIPLALAIGFIRYGWRPFDPLEWALVVLNVYFFVGVPEELLFRGLLQNLLEKRWRGRGGRIGPLAVASVIFGAAHLNNGPAPNVRYAILAALAGLAYGWVWRRTRKITASALTHGAVDWIWVVAFRAGIV
jgi:membrane protease YdiL (CAAX protease family)